MVGFVNAVRKEGEGPVRGSMNTKSKAEKTGINPQAARLSAVPQKNSDCRRAIAAQTFSVSQYG